MSDNLIKYLNESLDAVKISQGSFINIGGLDVYIADQKAAGINVHEIFDVVTTLIPHYLLTEFDYISVGDIPEFEERQINALTKDGVIYITSDQDDSADAVDDIIHEIAHTLEGKYGYEDAEYSEEFDKFLYKDIGYPTLVNLSMGLFMTPYGITSIREYWAESFEKYFLNQAGQLKKFCPIAFIKLEEITQND